MKNYYLTVFSQDGENLLDETITAASDEEAKQQGEKMLEEHEYSEHTHRLVTPAAKLLLFHR